MQEDTLPAVGIVGAGIMGAGIAEVCALAGLDTIVVESNPEQIQHGHQTIEQSLEKAKRKGRVSPASADGALGRLRITDAYASLADRDLVIEAVTEREDVKLKVLTTLDQVVEDPHAILATNTSSIPIMKLAMATSRRENVVGLHFVNPVPVRPLVELVPSLVTSETTLARVRGFAEGVLGKEVIVSKDRAGFIINALLIPFVLSAIRMYESGFATAEDIDAGMVRGCAHPMGPLAVADLVGLDTTLAVAHSLYEEFKEPQYAAPPLLLRMVDAGLLGRKSGRGFFEYARNVA